MDAKSSRVKELFDDRVLFEREVLRVENNNDRRDVVGILVNTLVRDTLKEHLNFLYIETFSDFSLKHIVNIIFKEMANEWADYAVTELGY